MRRSFTVFEQDKLETSPIGASNFPAQILSVTRGKSISSEKQRTCEPARSPLQFQDYQRHHPVCQPRSRLLLLLRAELCNGCTLDSQRALGSCIPRSSLAGIYWAGSSRSKNLSNPEVFGFAKAATDWHLTAQT